MDAQSAQQPEGWSQRCGQRSVLLAALLALLFAFVLAPTHLHQNAAAALRGGAK